MRQRHLLDQDEFRKGVEAGPAHRPKASKELLDLRRIELVLAKQGEYAEAQKVKVRADALEVAEADRAKAEREQQMLNAQGKFQARQEQELSALRQRIHTGAEEQRHARQQVRRPFALSIAVQPHNTGTRAPSRRHEPPLV